MTTKTKTVALVDSRWTGHHPTYFREFLYSLLRVGSRVIALCPEPEEFSKVAEEVCREMNLDPKEWIVTGSFRGPNKSFIFPGMDHDPLSTMWRWVAAGRSLRATEARSTWKADLVFFPWLDSYLRFLPHWRWAEWVLNRPWSGLYFRSHHLKADWKPSKGTLSGVLARLAKGDFNLKAPSCRSLGVLDERFTDEIEALCGKPVMVFPDVTDTTIEEAETSVVSAIRARAGKRKIIGMIGLEKRKGFLTLLKTAVRCSEKRPWYFVFAGSVSEVGLSKGDLEWIDVVDRSANERDELDCIHLDRSEGRISDSDYNALLSSFDVVFTAYHDFPGSSNNLTKSACFKRPVIVSRGHCMEKRVREYALGIAVDQDDVDQTIDAIEKVLEGKNLDGTPLECRFEEYAKLHSQERLDEVFGEVIQAAFGSGNRAGAKAQASAVLEKGVGS